MTDSFFVHPLGVVEPGAVIGSGSRVWAFAHVLRGARLGRDCNICDQVFIENDVQVGDRVTVKCGVQLWDGITLEDDVFVGPNATFTNDAFPRSKQYPQAFLRTVVQKGSSIGANATILPGVTIGRHSMIGAGAVVTHDVPPGAVVVGNPARVVGFVDTKEKRPLVPINAQDHEGAVTVQGVNIIKLKTVSDARGSLSVAEIGKQIDFDARRYFLVYDVPKYGMRGQHAHRRQHQFLTCVHGSCRVVVEDGHARDEIVLSSPAVGVYIPPLVWGIQYQYSSDAMLMVLVSDSYDPSDYINDYNEFLSLKSNG